MKTKTPGSSTINRRGFLIFSAFNIDCMHHFSPDRQCDFSPLEFASCAVTAPNGIIADGLLTRVMVLEKNDVFDLLTIQEGFEATMVDRNLNEFNSTGFFS